MSEMMDLDGLAERLAVLGEMLVFDDPDPATAARERLEHEQPATMHSPWPRRLLVAAAVILVVTTAVLLESDARSAVARWLGIGGVDVHLDPTLDTAAEPQTFEFPGPGESSVVEVDGVDVLVSAIPGRANEVLIDKTVNATSDATEVTVNGRPGLWIAGGPHEVVYETPDGSIQVERVAANTLLWYDGDTLYRVEGFETLDQALAFAARGT